MKDSERLNSSDQALFSLIVILVCLCLFQEIPNDIGFLVGIDLDFNMMPDWLSEGSSRLWANNHIKLLLKSSNRGQ